MRLPVFLSGKMQQCFCRMPGSTCVKTNKTRVVTIWAEKALPRQVSSNKAPGAAPGPHAQNHLTNDTLRTLMADGFYPQADQVSVLLTTR